MTDFLPNYQGTRRTWRDIDRAAQARGVYTAQSLTGEGNGALEVAYATAEQPTTSAVRDLWKQRHGRAAAPLLLIVGYPRTSPTRAMLCGPTGDDPAVTDVEHGLAERLAGAALAEPTRHQAITFLMAAMDGDPETLPGIRNKGLLATHALEAWVPQALDWDSATTRAQPQLAKRDPDLVRRLRYTIANRRNHQVLRGTDGNARAVAVFLQPIEQDEHPSPRFGNQTPVTAALNSAQRENLPWVISVRGGTVRLYSTQTSGSAGQRGRAETFVELNLPVLATAQAAYLDLLFSAQALEDDGTLARIREASVDYTSALSKRLRERVYDEVVPRLAIAVAGGVGGNDEAALQQHYRTALTILFRLLFIAYAEDSRLLPLHANADYTDHALKIRARRISDRINSGHDLGFDNPLTEVIEPTTDPGLSDLWDDCVALFRAVDKGAPAWDVPAYNGGLFSADPAVNPVGAVIESLTLANGEFGPALTALLVDRTPDGSIGPIDFRSLSVREFGTIYEGLLESELSVADQDLTLDRNDAYVPASGNDVVEVPKGAVYLHNASGARKSSGAYFTKPFAVEHLLDHSLEPALDDHLDRVRAALDSGRESDAADLLFDFRVADIAMGSGHFLTAVVDRLEARYSTFLADHPIPAITSELDHLRAAAEAALGGLAATVPLETTSLLRRLIARRCVYGVDINPLSVELARVSMWIHTFVPGLPLSFLNHNLTVGNSLTGVGHPNEIFDAFGIATSAQQAGLFDDPVAELLDAAREPLERLATIVDASMKEVEEARAAAAAVEIALAPLRVVCDLIAANRVGQAHLPAATSYHELAAAIEASAAEAGEDLTSTLDALQPAHFLVTFPEVFARERPGFDVMVGNPPYKEAVIEELAFWARHRPGLNAVDTPTRNTIIRQLQAARIDLVDKYHEEQLTNEMMRRSLHSGPFPGMSTGDPDLYKAFCWRFVHLTRSGGGMGLVLPRSVFATKGSTEWRTAFLPTSQTFVTTVRNTREWVFDGVNPGYTFVFLAISRLGENPEGPVRLAGRYDSRASYEAGLARPSVVLRTDSLSGRDDTLALPDLRSDGEASLFSFLLTTPTLGSETRPDFRARATTDFHATNDRKKTSILTDDGDWPVYNHLNVGHFTFDAQPGPFTRCNLDTAITALRQRQLRGARNSRSVFSEMFSALGTEWLHDPQSLPALQPRLAFRDVIHATNPRKVWVALMPAKTFLTNKAPYLVFPSGEVSDQAFLLAMMNSSVCDWYGHLFVNLNLNYFILNSLPIPHHDPHSERARRVVALAAALAISTEGDFGDEWRSLAAQDVTDHNAAVAEIDGLASLLYGISNEHLPIIWDDERDDLDRPALDDMLRHREKWS